jgi:hypothetical protein
VLLDSFAVKLRMRPRGHNGQGQPTAGRTFAASERGHQLGLKGFQSFSKLLDQARHASNLRHNRENGLGRSHRRRNARHCLGRGIKPARVLVRIHEL